MTARSQVRTWRSPRSERKRVAFVLGSYTLGGAERQLAALVTQRPAFARGVELEAVTFLPTTSPAVAAAFDAAGVRHTLIDRSTTSAPIFLLRLIRHFARTRPDIVHTVLDGSTGAWGRLAAWVARVPAIFHSDLSLAPGDTSLHRRLRPFLDRVTARFLPNAYAIADRLTESGVPRDRIDVLPCGVDLSRFRPSREATAHARAALGIAPDARVVGFLGRFVVEKRIDVLLDALLRMRPEDRPDVVLLAGDGPLQAEMRRRIEADPYLRRSCRLLGPIEEVPTFLAALDALLLTSDVEGLPNAVLEGMAMALPVVATSVSDLPRLLDGCGFVVPPGDPEAFAAALARLLRMPDDERAAMGARGRHRVEERYDLVRIAAEFWRIHLDAAGAPVLAESL